MHLCSGFCSVFFGRDDDGAPRFENCPETFLTVLYRNRYTIPITIDRCFTNSMVVYMIVIGRLQCQPQGANGLLSKRRCLAYKLHLGKQPCNHSLSELYQQARAAREAEDHTEELAFV